MKNYICLLAVLWGAVSALCGQSVQHTPPINGYQYIKIDDPDHDFGDVEFGVPVHYPVQLINISEDTLRLTNVIVSCGCTTPEYTKGVYAPGDTIAMKIGFNGRGSGAFNKTLSVLFEAPEGQFVNILRFRGKVVAKKTVTAPEVH